ncbi:hypothetical protein [Amycolatopsis sp. lyj-23]|uniref:hypothetical protein n=1 Tax=Amycolatopsis sp. lyj-23 TaxID=2789283 RepID=UPI00397BBE18
MTAARSPSTCSPHSRPEGDTDLVVVVIAEEHDRGWLPLRAAIAALEAELRPAGPTVLGGGPWRDYRRPTHLGTVIASRADLDFAAPIHLGGDARHGPGACPSPSTVNLCRLTSAASPAG